MLIDRFPAKRSTLSYIGCWITGYTLHSKHRNMAPANYIYIYITFSFLSLVYPTPCLIPYIDYFLSFLVMELTSLTPSCKCEQTHDSKQPVRQISRSMRSIILPKRVHVVKQVHSNPLSISLLLICVLHTST